MLIQPIKTRVLMPPQDDLLAAIRESIVTLQEKTIVVVTSKVISVWQGRCIPIAEVVNKDDLIKKEADYYLERDEVPNGWVMHTLKNNLLIPSAGIDESNAYDHFILWPDKIAETAREIGLWLQKEYRVRQVGVLITDSHSIMRRRGVVGISLGHWGFNPLHDYRHEQDIFGRALKISQTNIPDGLAAAAVTVMGEGAEKTPIAVITDVPSVVFNDGVVLTGDRYSSFEIKPEEDIYEPFITKLPWKKGGNNPL